MRCHLPTQYKSPTNDSDILADGGENFRNQKKPLEKKYDLVVIGGGYSGLGAAISGARMGCKVALIQDRGVLGGNGSSEVVSGQGNIRRGKYPRIGNYRRNLRSCQKVSGHL